MYPETVRYIEGKERLGKVCVYVTEQPNHLQCLSLEIHIVRIPINWSCGLQCNDNSGLV
jgi:hypothetical protein